MDPAQQQMQQFQEQQATVDASHLRLLSIFHYVFGGLCMLGGVFMIGYIFLMRFIMEQSASSSPGGADAEQVKTMITYLAIFYGAMGVLCFIESICNILCGWFLTNRKHKIFIFIISGFNCLSIPLGTTLGVFTFIVLMRPSVAATFDSDQAF